MVLAKHAIRLREIQANIIGNHAIFTNVHLVSQSTLASILKRHQVQMKQLLSVLYFQFFFYCNCNLYWIQNFTFVWYLLSLQCYAHYCSSMKTGTCFVVILHVDMLTDLGIWRGLNYIFISLQHWSCVVFVEFIVYLHFLCVLHLHYSNHWEVELLKVF